MTGQPGTIGQVVAQVTPRGKVEGSARRAMTMAAALRAVLLMTLMPAADYGEILSALFGDLALLPWQVPFAVPTDTVLATWRDAAGPEPVRRLQDMVLAASDAEYREHDYRAIEIGDLHLGSIDGSVTRMPDTPGNRAEFGSAGTADDSAPYPQLRGLPVTYASTRAMLAVVTGPSGGDKAAAEQALLDRALAGYRWVFTKRRLFVMDRNFPGVPRIESLVKVTHVLIRLKSDVTVTKIGGFLPDGSYLADIGGKDAKIGMRVIEYYVEVEGQEVPGLNRVARLQGRTTPRPVKAVDRPREEWTEIPVPAIVDQDTFARVQQRLEDNKKFATRGARVPSLLQGLAACAACGYGYYRTSTRTARKKIYYYRCLGSDNYRYEGGRVCGNKPVRADYLDQVVWDHITGLLADPALIRAEIAKRLEQARTSDPVTRQRTQIELALAKAATSITAMIQAYSEQLITIDELRDRMPHLRAREASLRGQLDALDAQAADRDAYLKLAGDLEGFLARLRGSTSTARTEDRQRVLRLLVKDVLIGPEKITIRHRIPVREPATSGGGHHDTTDTEGDMRESYELCWGRGFAVAR